MKISLKKILKKIFKARRLKKRKKYKLAIDLKEKDKFILPGGQVARIVAPPEFGQLRSSSGKGKTIECIILTYRTEKEAQRKRTHYLWNAEVSVPWKDDPKAKLPWLHSRLVKWSKNLEIKPAW